MPKPAKPKGKKGRGADMKLIGAVGGGLAALLTLGLGAAYLMQGGGSPPLPAAKKAAAAGPSLYEMSATTMDGESVSISSFRGKALLMLNVASRWGSTATVYEQLATWHRKYGDKLEILLFPVDEFRQELPSEQIEPFVKQQGLPTSGGGCTLMSKVEINGPATAPLWSYAKRVNRIDNIGWNFDGIFVFDGDGHAQGRYHRGDLPGADAALRRILG